MLVHVGVDVEHARSDWGDLTREFTPILSSTHGVDIFSGVYCRPEVRGIKLIFRIEFALILSPRYRH